MSENEVSTLTADLWGVKKKYVDETLKWYTTRAPGPRIMFRVSGTLVIIASLSIPFLSSSQNETIRAVGAPVAAFITAVLTALSSFYGWHGTWQKYITTQLLIEGFVATWEVEMAAAKVTSDQKKAEELATVATHKLINQTKEVVTSEAYKFFANIKWPEKKETKP